MKQAHDTDACFVCLFSNATGQPDLEGKVLVDCHRHPAPGPAVAPLEGHAVLTCPQQRQKIALLAQDQRLHMTGLAAQAGH